MNILVTGANGQLGNEMRLLASGNDNHFVFADIVEAPGVETRILDITDAEAVKSVCLGEKINALVNCAAYTNVDKAEEDEATAELLNATAVGNLAAGCKAAGAKLIHISTDYVFPGNAFAPLRETDAVNPVSAYGRTKLAGERRAAECDSIVIRTAWLYSPFGKNFVKTMLKLTAEKDSLNVVFDQVGSPTAAIDLAKAIMHIIGSDGLKKTGVYHFSNEGAISWYDFTQAIAEIAGNKCDIRPCLSSEFPSKVARPHYSVLDKSLIKSTFGVDVPYWRDSLEKCIKRLV